MTSVNEWIVKEYFELLGYLVNQPRKHAVPGRQKTADEEIDLVVFNPRVKDFNLPDNFVWTASDLSGVSRAVVAVRGWHTERFYASTFEQTPDILRFVEPASVRFAEALLGAGPMAKILCLPRLPVSEELMSQTIKVLKEKGVDGVICFKTMLWELVSRVDVNKNYDKSDLLQVIRLLKNYELIKDSQMEFWQKDDKL